MAETTKQLTKKPAAKSEGFSDFEKAAMKERAQELKAAARADKDREFGESSVLAKINEMVEPDRSMGMRIHEIVKANAPDLWPKLWYGMPAYAKDGKVILFFQSGNKYKTRYCTLGFSDLAHLDEGNMWPSGFALAGLTTEVEHKIASLVKKAVS